MTRDMTRYRYCSKMRRLTIRNENRRKCIEIFRAMRIEQRGSCRAIRGRIEGPAERHLISKLCRLFKNGSTQTNGIQSVSRDIQVRENEESKYTRLRG